MRMNEPADVVVPIDRWRAHLLQEGAEEARVAALEERLHEQQTALQSAGLDAEEAFFVALRRLAADDAASREFARDYSCELLATGSQAAEEAQTARPRAITEFWLVLACAVAAAVAIKVPSLFGYRLGGPGEAVYVRNLSLFVLPFLSAYFVWKQRPGRWVVGVLAAAFTAGALFVNAYPFAPNGSTQILSALHLPIALWLAVGVAYVGGDWLSDGRRMEFVRFTGEWLVSYALIALGGAILIAIAAGVFESIGINIESIISGWVLPCGATGAVIVAAWLAGMGRTLVGGMAPMLARVFTPLFAFMLAGLLAGVVWTRGVIHIEREVLLIFDVLLVLVLALLIYAISARDSLARPGLFDWIQLVLVACALVVDVFALVNIAARVNEFGLSANRTAALGLNLIILVNLAWSALLQLRFVRGHAGVEPIARWQTRYLPVYALWAAFVVVVFPLVFRFA